MQGHSSAHIATPLFDKGIQTEHVELQTSIYLASKIAARALATNLIPGCVGRRVRLGSENSTGAAGGVWKSGNLEIWEFGNLEIWGPGHLEIWGPKNKTKLKNKIRSPKNVDRVWISRNEQFVPLAKLIQKIK